MPDQSQEQERRTPPPLEVARVRSPGPRPGVAVLVIAGFVLAVIGAALAGRAPAPGPTATNAVALRSAVPLGSGGPTATVAPAPTATAAPGRGARGLLPRAALLSPRDGARLYVKAPIEVRGTGTDPSQYLRVIARTRTGEIARRTLAADGAGAFTAYLPVPPLPAGTRFSIEVFQLPGDFVLATANVAAAISSPVVAWRAARTTDRRGRSVVVVSGATRSDVDIVEIGRPSGAASVRAGSRHRTTPSFGPWRTYSVEIPEGALRDDGEQRVRVMGTDDRTGETGVADILVVDALAP